MLTAALILVAIATAADAVLWWLDPEPEDQ